MTERALTRRILKRLNAEPDCLAIKVHGGPYARAGEPDIVGCCAGQAFAIEVKAAGGKVRPAQWERLKAWRRAGAVAVVAREDFSVREFVEGLRETTEE